MDFLDNSKTKTLRVIFWFSHWCFLSKLSSTKVLLTYKIMNSRRRRVSYSHLQWNVEYVRIWDDIISHFALLPFSLWCCSRIVNNHDCTVPHHISKMHVPRRGRNQMFSSTWAMLGEGSSIWANIIRKKILQ